MPPTLALFWLSFGLLLGAIPESTRKLFDYDSTAPLNLTQKPVDQAFTPARLSAIEYDSPRGGRVTGYLVEPRHVGRHRVHGRGYALCPGRSRQRSGAPGTLEEENLYCGDFG
jgi:hypothetical protein